MEESIFRVDLEVVTQQGLQMGRDKVYILRCERGSAFLGEQGDHMSESRFEKRMVLVITTGGTIEKSYCEEDGSVQNRESVLRTKLLSRLRLPYTDIRVVEIMAKDSLNMTDEDRHFILDKIRASWKSQKTPIVVLHGTDTLEKTVRLCFEQEPEPPVPVIFTGAMRPAGFDDSDAQQNFTEALFISQNVDPGFYLSFHGRLFKAPSFRKNPTKRTFEPLS